MTLVERDLLRQALEHLEWASLLEHGGNERLENDIRAFLEVEPESDELVGQRKVFICTNCDCVYEVSVSECDCACGANQFTEAFIVTKPLPARKPMTKEELDALIGEKRVDELTARIYKWGFRDAEKHHGIIDSNRSPAITDTNYSIDLQSKCRGDKL
jgi:hypothetical protein